MVGLQEKIKEITIGDIIIAAGAILVIGAICYGLLTTPPQAILNIPSEEQCQRLVGYGTQEKIVAERMFCEFNESGWHLNKTKFILALRDVQT